AVVVAAPARAAKEQTEEELVRELAKAPEIGLGRARGRIVGSWRRAYSATTLLHQTPDVTAPGPLLGVRPDLRLLPVRGGSAAKVSPRAARELGVLARKLKVYLDGLAPLGPDGRRTNPEKVAEALRREKRGKRPEWLRVAALPTLMQMLTHEERSLRLTLVELLAEIPEPRAPEALAQRAVFDLDAGVRRASVTALKKRSPDDYRPVLMRALRYPWSPPAKYAARALRELNDRGAIPELVTLLKMPDPASP